jgi:hypothetical protein
MTMMTGQVNPIARQWYKGRGTSSMNGIQPGAKIRRRKVKNEKSEWTRNGRNRFKTTTRKTMTMRRGGTRIERRQRSGTRRMVTAEVIR